MYRDMDREDQQEFADYGNAIHERKVKNARVNLKRKMQTDMDGEAAKRSRGRGRGRGLEDEAGPSVEASAVASSSAPPPSAAREAPAEQPFRGRRTFGRAASGWTCVWCTNGCRGIAGKYKRQVFPGARDQDTWDIRAVDVTTHTFGTRAPFRRTVVCHKEDE